MNSFAKKLKKYFHDGVRMQYDAALYLQFIEEEEGIAKRRIRVAALILSIEGAALLWLWIQGTSVPFLGGLLAVCCLSLSLGYRSHVRQSWAREETMLEELGIDPELLEEGSVRQKLVLAAETGTFNQVQVEKMTGSIRGQDEKGFTGGVQKDRLDSSTMRRDVKESAGAYEGLEGDLRRSEHLVNEANERYGAVANEQWSVAESKDQDLIEAGVERLGDLVRTDWFEKNAKDGAVDELMGQGQKE
jgi:hypothetical protein